MYVNMASVELVKAQTSYPFLLLDGLVARPFYIAYEIYNHVRRNVSAVGYTASVNQSEW